MLINGAPEPERLAGNLHHDFVKMPDVARAALVSPQVPRDLWPEFRRPAPNRFIGDIDATFEQHLLDLPQAQIEPDVQPDRVGNDRRREPVPLVADGRRLHRCDLRLKQRPGNRYPVNVTTPC